MTEQTNNEWLKKELAENIIKPEFEELPSFKLNPNVVTEITVDFSKPFEEWRGEQGGKTIIKKIIPVTSNGIKMNWWLNVKNPIYREVLQVGYVGVNTIKLLQTGTKADTKYVLVK